MNRDKFDVLVGKFPAQLAVGPAVARAFSQRLAHISEIANALVRIGRQCGEQSLRDAIGDLALDVSICLAAPSGEPNLELSSWRIHTSWLENYSTDEILGVITPQWNSEMNRSVPAIGQIGGDTSQWLEVEGNSLRSILRVLPDLETEVQIVSMLWLLDVVLSRLNFGLTKCRALVR